MNKLKSLIPSVKILSFCLILSCSSQIEQQYSVHPDNKEDFVCLKEGRGCGEFPDCRSFCEDLFFNEEKRQKCYNWPMSLFEDFNNLKEILDNESFQYIDPFVLKCFLDWADEDKDILFKSFNEDSAKKFLEEIAYNATLAFHLGGKDKGDFSILNTLFKKIDNRVTDAVGESLFEQNNFLILIHEQSNRSAWTWLNDYIIHECQKDRRCKGPLDYYCKILKNVRSQQLRDFFDNQHFKREYIREIESKTCSTNSCEYGDSWDFNKLCDNF